MSKEIRVKTNYVTFTAADAGGNGGAGVQMSVRPVWRGWRRCGTPALAAAFALALGACAGNGSGGSGSVNIANGQGSDPATVDYPIFYVKRTVPTNQDGTLMQDDLRILRDLVPGADLYMRASASPSAVETNITARVTAGAMYDVKDVDVAADGSSVVFALRGPLTKNQQTKNPPSWRIWQYVIATDTLTPVINPAIDPDPLTVNDVSPHYLADGRIVFSSTRQSQSEGVLLNYGFPQFSYDDEARQEPAFVLEVMNADGTGIHQISFNQSHDQDATVLQNGRVLWSRWDNSPGHDAMSLYSSNPDGTDLELYYGANSHLTGSVASGTTAPTVVEFVRPHEMQSGSIMALIRQYTDVDDGGNLVVIDGVHYAENFQSLQASPYDYLPTSYPGPAQTPATTLQNIYTIPGPSPGGRFNSAYPLWDGTGRILVSWSECRLLDTTQTPPTIVPCTTSALASPTAQSALPLYSVWMLDPAQNTLMPIVAPVEGVMVTDVVAAQPKPVPNIIQDTVPTGQAESFASSGLGVIDIRSVYDIDGLAVNPATGAPVSIAALADPAQTAASARPARFIRLEKAVSIPDKTVVDLSGAAFGASNYMMQIMGYAPIEPDGSVHLEVPAQVAFRISVLDANARAITPPQGVWLQLQPGETVSCNGCHKPQGGAQQPVSHGRQGLFASAWAGGTADVAFPHTIATGPAAFIPTQNGETMAQARMAVSCATDTPPCLQMVPGVNVLYTDVWTDPAQATPNPPITYSYTDPSNPIPAIPTTALCATSWSSNCLIIINYPEHIQKIWDAVRPDPVNAAISRTCTQGGCHNPLNAMGTAQTPAANLDLTSSVSSTTPPELTSYVQLLFPHNIVVNMQTQAVGPFLNAGSANGGQSAQFFSLFATGGQHPGWLNPAELRVLSEWLDIGAQYFNNPFDPAVPVN
ncbi:MAG: hypothetical protein ACLPTM_11905 [Steroidobacteraceae bacterium]